MEEPIVRRQEPRDAEALHAVYGQPGVIRGTLQMPYPSLQEWQAGCAKEPRNMIRLVASVADQVVGNIALWTMSSPRRRHAGELAMAVHDAWHGKGCGRVLLLAALDVADQWMGLQRVELQVFADNERACRLYERAGFEVEGVFKQFAFRDGKYCDVLAMARLRQGR